MAVTFGPEIIHGDERPDGSFSVTGGNFLRSTIEVLISLLSDVDLTIALDATVKQ